MSDTTPHTPMRRKHLRYHLDLALLALILSGFVLVTAQRLGSVPLPETDEAYTLQVPYEMLVHGKLALPMLRYLGGDIENHWHSYTPVYFVILGGFLKLTGWGLLQGRIFNLITAVGLLLMVYALGRRLFDWRVGLMAIVLLLSDITFIERSRMLRNDYLAAFFAMLGFYLYEVGRRRQQARYYLASGLAVGCGVMCHTNILYMICAIGLMILLDQGWRAFRKRPLYAFAGGALAVMAYEIVYDLIDYKNYLLQNRQDKLHFMLFEPGGLWQNFVGEAARYRAWYTARSQYAGTHYGLIFQSLPHTLSHAFQLLTAAAIIYLLWVCARRIRQRQAMSDCRVHLLIVTLVTVLFHAIITGHKEIYYMAHLAPWFALAAAVMLKDAYDRVGRLRLKRRPQAQWLYKTAIVATVIAGLTFGVMLARLYKKYGEGLRNPNLVTFDEYETTLRELIPDEVCPVVRKISPAVWLAFPEKDACFADIENRVRKAVDIDGKDYALLTPDVWPEYHLLGELKDTAYGPSIYIYYTGSDPRFSSLPSRRYRFFNWQRGHVEEPLVNPTAERKASPPAPVPTNDHRAEPFSPRGSRRAG